MFPPAPTARDGDPSVTITYNGISYPTGGHMVWPNLHTMMRRADFFPEPDAFIPERFLSAPDNWPGQKEIVKDSWRPFEKGPRAFIGQELAIIDIKLIMVLTLREFDISAEYEEWDRRLGREKPGDMLGGKRGMFGMSSCLLRTMNRGLPLIDRETYLLTGGRLPCVPANESFCEACRWNAFESEETGSVTQSETASFDGGYVLFVIISTCKMYARNLQVA